MRRLSPISGSAHPFTKLLAHAVQETAWAGHEHNVILLYYNPDRTFTERSRLQTQINAELSKRFSDKQTRITGRLCVGRIPCSARLLHATLLGMNVLHCSNKHFFDTAVCSFNRLLLHLASGNSHF